MREIGLFDAKTNLSKIAEQVRRTGQPVTLTKRGEPYVDLVPHRGNTTRRSRSQVLAELAELRTELPKSSAAQIKADLAAGAALMGAIVIDASIVLAWLFDEEPTAAKIKPALDKSELIAPWLWRLEVANAVLVRTRRKLLTDTQAIRLLRLLDELPIEFNSEPEGRTASGLAQFARPHQLSAYHAVYLDLAHRLNLPLFTRDKNLRVAAKRAGVGLVHE